MILLIEDDLFQRQMVYLALSGRTPMETAWDRESALAALGRRRYRLVMTDLRLPGVADPYEWLREIRTLHAGDLAVSSGVTGPEISSLIREAGARPLTKPYRLEELFRAVLPAET